MAFEWKAFLDLARDLQTRARGATNPEAFLRSALSRAYYAAFCYARNYAQAYLQFDARGDPDDHGRLRHHLRSKKRGSTATRLDRLRQWRNESDYHDEMNIDLSQAAEAALVRGLTRRGGVESGSWTACACCCASSIMAASSVLSHRVVTRRIERA